MVKGKIATFDRVGDCCARAIETHRHTSMVVKTLAIILTVVMDDSPRYVLHTYGVALRFQPFTPGYLPVWLDSDISGSSIKNRQGQRLRLPNQRFTSWAIRF
jgi:hypothetical protein